MGMLSTIVCKTVGIAGMSAAIYDAYSVGKAQSLRTQQAATADSFERIHSQTRTLSTESPVNSAVQNKLADLRMNNPIVPAAGRVKGFFSGMFNSLGNNIVPVSFAALALTTKGFFSKVGAWGVGITALVRIAKEGFGVGKSTPMD